MADNTGISLRAEIDAFTVKSLLMLNGGGVVALLAFTPAIMSKDDYSKLLDAAFVGIIFFVVGLSCAVVHNICRRKCSLHHEQHNMEPPRGRVLYLSLWVPGYMCCWNCLQVVVARPLHGWQFVSFHSGSLWYSAVV